MQQGQHEAIFTGTTIHASSGPDAVRIPLVIPSRSITEPVKQRQTMTTIKSDEAKIYKFFLRYAL